MTIEKKHWNIKKKHKKELAEQQLQSHMCFCGIYYTQCNELRHSNQQNIKIL
jgi:hypothetical protein